MNRVLTANTPAGNALWAISLTGTEGLSELFAFDVVFKSNDRDIDCQAMIGEACAIRLETQDVQERWLHGHMVRFAATGRWGDHWRYEATVAPKLWHAGRRADYRVFQNRTVQQIVTELLDDNAVRHEWRIKNDYPVEVYVTQYGDTDLAFIRRLLESAGIYWWHEHGPDGHVLVLADHFSTHEPFPGYTRAPFYGPDHARPDEDHFHLWRLSREVEPGRYRHTDYDFLHPSKDLTTEQADPRGHLFDQYEIYAWRGGYTQTADGLDYAAARLEEWQRDQDRIVLEGRVRGAAPGYRLELHNHPRADQNRELLVVRATYTISNNAYEGTAAAESADFSVRVEAMPANRQYRPPLKTPKPRTRGPETAVVVGPPGSEIHTDEHGRVRVLFHWFKRHSKGDGADSCWVRVAHPWAGANFGVIHVPRVGQEVIVDFEGGDPDRPIVTGRVYNAEQMPPWPLPANATQSGILTRSSPGGGYENANAIRFEDKKGAEELWIHAERNQRIEVEQFESHFVGASRDKNVTQSETTHIGEDRVQTVGGQHTETVTRDIRVTSTDGNIVTTAGRQSIVLKAEKHIVLKVGASVIVMDADGTIKIHGPKRVDLNPSGLDLPFELMALLGEVL